MGNVQITPFGAVIFVIGLICSFAILCKICKAQSSAILKDQRISAAFIKWLMGLIGLSVIIAFIMIMKKAGLSFTIKNLGASYWYLCGVLGIMSGMVLGAVICSLYYRERSKK